MEEASDQYGKRIAILGGLDLDFVVRQSPEKVYDRACRMLEKTGGIGYALGTGNSIPDYVPPENFFALNAAAVYNR